MESILTKIKARSVVPAISVAAVLQSSMAQAPIDHRFSTTPVAVDSFKASPRGTREFEESTTTVSVRVAPNEWTRKMQKRFDELSRFEALGSITKDQLAELNTLSSDKRRLLYPRSAEEVLRELKARQLTEQLVKALNEYAHFHAEDSAG